MCSVTNETQARDAARAAVERFGHIDVLVNNDPGRLAEAMIALVNATNPPRRLPLGAEVVQRIEQKHREVEAELAPRRALAMSTAFVGGNKQTS